MNGHFVCPLASSGRPGRAAYGLAQLRSLRRCGPSRPYALPVAGADCRYAIGSLLPSLANSRRRHPGAIGHHAAIVHDRRTFKTGHTALAESGAQVSPPRIRVFTAHQTRRRRKVGPGFVATPKQPFFTPSHPSRRQNKSNRSVDR